MKNFPKMMRQFSLPAFFLTVLLCCFSTAMAQTTAFNFQGRLNDGNSPANGRYDLQFKLFDSITGGNQVGSAIPKLNLMLVNGVYSTQLDFRVTGTISAFYYDNNPKFVEVSLRPTAASGTTATHGTFPATATTRRSRPRRTRRALRSAKSGKLLISPPRQQQPLRIRLTQQSSSSASTT